jgi:hypothetical protein
LGGEALEVGACINSTIAMENNNSIIAVLVLVVIVLVGLFAFKQGYFTGASNNADGIKVEIPLGGTQAPK